jgi:hypothetical protein
MYCGDDRVGGDPQTLYECTEGNLQTLKRCQGKCVTDPHGPDYCEAHCTSGAFYCGDNGPDGDPKTLFRCDRDRFKAVRTCGDGCVHVENASDYCKATCTEGALYCGDNGPGDDADALFRCTKDHFERMQTCPKGCLHVAGDSDRCKPNCANGALYCGDDDVNGDPSTLYKCVEGTLVVEQRCPNGCVTVSGKNDHCAE